MKINDCRLLTITTSHPYSILLILLSPSHPHVQNDWLQCKCSSCSRVVQVCRAHGEIPGRGGAPGPGEQHLSGPTPEKRMHRVRHQYKVSDARACFQFVSTLDLLQFSLTQFTKRSGINKAHAVSGRLVGKETSYCERREMSGESHSSKQNGHMQTSAQDDDCAESENKQLIKGWSGCSGCGGGRSCHVSLMTVIVTL